MPVSKGRARKSLKRPQTPQHVRNGGMLEAIVVSASQDLMKYLVRFEETKPHDKHAKGVEEAAHYLQVAALAMATAGAHLRGDKPVFESMRQDVPE